MWVSAKTEYALRVAHHLAANYGRGRTTLREIAECQRIPLKFLEQVLMDLRRAGVVLSARGSRGGYILAAPPREVTVGQVIRATEGSLDPVPCLGTPAPLGCHRPSPCDFGWLWGEVKTRVEGLLDNVNFETVCERTQRFPSELAG
ncbi:MAG: RrF2 family transcriptional regulator [Nitrospinota bacterium]